MVVAIIGILSSVIYVSFGAARNQAQDDTLKQKLELIQLALEIYRSQNGFYPGKDDGYHASANPDGAPYFQNNHCSGGVCVYKNSDSDINNLPFIPYLTYEGYINDLPEQSEYATGCEFIYQVTEGTGDAYKVIAHNCVEEDEVIATDDFARCGSTCTDPSICNPDDNTKTYAVYRGGAAQCW